MAGRWQNRNYCLEMPLALLSAEESDYADPSKCNEGGSEGEREHKNFSPFITPLHAHGGPDLSYAEPSARGQVQEGSG